MCWVGCREENLHGKGDQRGGFGRRRQQPRNSGQRREAFVNLSPESLEPLRGGTGFPSGTKRLKGGLRPFTSAPMTTPHWARPGGAHRQAPHSEQLPQTWDPPKDVAPQLSRSLSLIVFKPPYLSGTDLQTRKCG